MCWLGNYSVQELLSLPTFAKHRGPDPMQNLSRSLAAQSKRRTSPLFGSNFFVKNARSTRP